jgi:hypothetical protein
VYSSNRRCRDQKRASRRPKVAVTMTATTGLTRILPKINDTKPNGSHQWNFARENLSPCMTATQPPQRASIEVSEVPRMVLRSNIGGNRSDEYMYRVLELFYAVELSAVADAVRPVYVPIFGTPSLLSQ